MKKIIKFLKQLKSQKAQAGFTLTELMVATSIIGCVASVSAAQMDDVTVMARDAQRMANIHQVQTALNIYYNDHSEYPVPSDSEATVSNWQEMKAVLEGNSPTPYMPEVPHDPLDTGANVFKYWSDGQTFKLVYETEDILDASPRIAWGM